uniref:Uncharacterized protein n=1 Tax=Fagus sylvatica TaxID=28930 RepID=A0A2N9GV46_FAGSY
MVRKIKNPKKAKRKSKPYRVHWCPFGELARIPTSFDHIEFTGVHSVNWPEFLHPLRAYVLVPVHCNLRFQIVYGFVL